MAQEEQKFRITMAGFAFGNKRYSARSYDFDELFDVFTTHSEQPKKDSPCFVAGTLIDGIRKLPNVEEISLLVYDIDGGASIEELDKLLESLGVLSIMYTTYSHEATKTLVKTGAYTNWATANKLPNLPTKERMEEYLAFAKKTAVLEKNPVFDPEGDLEENSDGAFYVITHDPIDKVRIVLPLDKPIKIKTLAASSKGCEAEYKRIYHGVGQALGFNFDTACSDPTRLHYLPSHPPGATNFRVIYNENGKKFLNWEAYPRADLASANPAKRESIRDNVTGEMREVRPADYVVVDRNGHRIDLYKWAKANLAEFDLEDLLRQKLPDDMLRNERSNGGFHIGCPFEHEHTKHGSLGTFIANGDGEKWAVIHCMHQSCTSQQRLTLDFLKELVVQQYLVAEDFLGKASVADKNVSAILKNLGADIEHIPSFTAPHDEEEEDPEIAEPVFENTADIEAIKEQAFKLLREAKYAGHAVAGLTAFYKFKIEDQLNYDDVLECLIESPITIPSMKKFHKTCKFHFDSAGILWEEIHDRFVTARCVEADIMSRTNEMVDTELQGAKLKAAQRYAADWFGCPMRSVEEAYRMQSKARHEQELDKLLVERMQDLNNYAVLTMGDRTVYLDMNETRRTGEPEIRTEKAMATLFKNATVSTFETNKEGGKKEKVYNVFSEWSKREKGIPIYKGLTFDPNQPPVTKDGKFNQYLKGRWGLRPKKGDCTRVLNHILEVWCEGNEDIFNWVIMYLANIFQRPGDKPHSAIALLGAPGTGKSIILEHGLAHMLGNMYGKSAQRKHMTGHFNSHVGGKLLWLAEESLFAGDVEGMNVLKDMIASETLMVEPKNYNAYPVPNHTRFFFTSNSVHALKLEADDRRFLVLKASEKYKQNSQYFTELRHWMTKENGNNYFLHYLLNWKPEEHGMSWTMLFNPPMTPHKMGQIDMSRDAAEEFFAELLLNGRITSVPASEFIEGRINWPLTLPSGKSYYPISMNTFRTAFDTYLEHHRAKKYDRNKYGALFAKYMGKQPGELSDVHRVQGRAMRCFRFEDRRAYLVNAIKNGLMHINDLKTADENPESHRPPVDEDE